MSGEHLVNEVMNTLSYKYSNITYGCKHFGGIGGFSKSANISRIKTNKILNDLDMYLSAFNKKFQTYEVALFIVLDNDKRNCQEFEQELKEKANSLNLTIDYVFCIAVEEIEAWLLGDLSAIQKAYPQAKLSASKNYIQDSICGTWEILANVVYPGGVLQLIKNSSGYAEIGKMKCEWAKKIGKHLDLDNNASPSFQKFISEIKNRIS